MRYYAIADLHGRFDLLKLAFEKITEHALKNPITEVSKIITLGDYIDRGPQSKQVIEFLMDRQDGSQLGSNLICLKGNHEDMMVQTIRTPLDPDWWLGNGGNTTMKSYGSEVRVSPYYGIPPVGWDPHVVYPSHVEWIANLPLYYETEKQVFVHAGIPFPDVPLDKQDEEKMIWMLYGNGEIGGWQGKHVVHGHHQFADGPHEYLGGRGGRTDLDVFAWHEGRIVIGVFNDAQEHALEFIEVLAE